MLAQARLAWRAENRAEWEQEQRGVPLNPAQVAVPPALYSSPVASQSSGSRTVRDESVVATTVSSGVAPGTGDARRVEQNTGNTLPVSVVDDASRVVSHGSGAPVPVDQSTHASGSTVRFATIMLEKFDGSGSWESFKVKFQSLAELGNWTEQEQKIRLINALDGPAVQVIWGVDKSTTVPQLLDRLTRQFGTADQNLRFRADLKNLKRGSRTLQQLHLEVCRLLALAYPRDSGSIFVATAIDAFCEALEDATLRCKILEAAPDNL